MKDEFTGMVAVVTGAAQGIGHAIATELHAQGARLVLVDCNAAGSCRGGGGNCAPGWPGRELCGYGTRRSCGD